MGKDWDEFEKQARESVETALYELKAAHTADGLDVTGPTALRTIQAALLELAESILGARLARRNVSKDKANETPGRRTPPARRRRRRSWPARACARRR